MHIYNIDRKTTENIPMDLEIPPPSSLLACLLASNVGHPPQLPILAYTPIVSYPSTGRSLDAYVAACAGGADFKYLLFIRAFCSPCGWNPPLSLWGGGRRNSTTRSTLFFFSRRTLRYGMVCCVGGMYSHHLLRLFCRSRCGVIVVCSGCMYMAGLNGSWGIICVYCVADSV